MLKILKRKNDQDIAAGDIEQNAIVSVIYDGTSFQMLSQLGTSAGSMSSWTLSGDSGSNQTINDGNTVDIAGGTGIDTVAGSTDTVTVSVDSTICKLNTANTWAAATTRSHINCKCYWFNYIRFYLSKLYINCYW